MFETDKLSVSITNYGKNVKYIFDIGVCKVLVTCLNQDFQDL